MEHLVDTSALKRAHPIAEVIAGYDIELRPQGRAFVGRCPFHVDRGRPNLYVYPESNSFYCYSCGVGGDTITFVERIEEVGFRQAVARLTGQQRNPSAYRSRSPRRIRSRSKHTPARGPAERACLAAAVELYHNRLMTDPEPLAYVEQRGLDRATMEQCRVGYAAGDELAAYLRWRHLPLTAALRVGLIRHGGREWFAGRIIVPEIRRGQPIWLVGRGIAPDSHEPKYFGLPGRKPLLGWEAARGHRAVCVVEGAFDWLVLRSWGVPALALVGTHPGADNLRELAHFTQVYLVLDTDEAGRHATRSLAQTLGHRAIPVTLPGVKDIAELAEQPDGRRIFAHALSTAASSAPE